MDEAVEAFRMQPDYIVQMAETAATIKQSHEARSTSRKEAIARKKRLAVSEH